ncbi:hypothetical protein B1H10_04905 [candidate division KSB1 bacterium 4484_188]|nr:MAG: hypothetical protein B1H10_04905 [candidate division KSB1 bacterium 4484_188]HFE64665.1 hypothetical protein [Caldithrix sp.]
MGNQTIPDIQEHVDEVLKQAFTFFFAYVAEATGKKQALEFARKSHQIIEKYFHNLGNFKISKNGQLQIKAAKLSDKEILAFSVWMQQFLKELKNFMIGLGRVDPKEITRDLQEELKELGFYEFFEQAKELNY